MKTLILSSLLLATCSAQYLLDPRIVDPRIVDPRIVDPRIINPWSTWGINTLATPYISPITVPTSSQYRVQDELGQFAFGHRGDNQARDEVKSFDGSVHGSYSYVDPTGKLINVRYLADHNGYRVLGANNLPVAPELPLVPELKGPEPVSDTAEVVAARADFAKAFAKEEMREEKKEEKKEEAKDRKKRALFLNPITGTVPLTTSYIHHPIITPSFYTLPLTKTIVKTAEFKTDDEAKTPAATKKAEIKEKDLEIVQSPWGSILPIEKVDELAKVKLISTPLGLVRTVELEKDDKKEKKEEEKEKIEKKIWSPIPLATPYFI